MERLKKWFFTTTNQLRADGTTGGIRFKKMDKPTQTVMEDLLDSVPMKLESDDRAKVHTGSADLSDEVGLVVLATNAQAKANQAQLADRSLVVQPHQLPTTLDSKLNTSNVDIDGSDAALGASTKTTLSTAGFNLETNSTLKVTIDSSVSTRNKYFYRISNYFLNWLADSIIPRLFKTGGSANQVPKKIDGTNYNWSWGTIAFSELSGTATDSQLPVVPITKGGTGQTTANTALNALLPSQTSNSGKVLQTDGTNTSWQTPASTTLKVSSNDSTSGYLNGKLVAGTGITLTENNDGANETLTASISYHRDAVGSTPNTAYPLVGTETELAAYAATAGKNRNYSFTLVLDHNRITTSPTIQIRFYKNSIQDEMFQFAPVPIDGHPFTLTFIHYFNNVSPGDIMSVGLYSTPNQINVRRFVTTIDGYPIN